MQLPDNNFLFDINFNFATDSLFVAKNENESAPFPPISGNFLLLDGSHFLLLDGTDFLLL